MVLGAGASEEGRTGHVEDEAVRAFLRPVGAEQGGVSRGGVCEEAAHHGC